jgi:hypothetical protein
MANKDEWARAFAQQAEADFDAWNALQIYLKLPARVKPIARCQKLHFLQMACEKLTKAHLLKAGSQLSNFEQSHAYIAKHLPVIVRQQMIMNGENKRVADRVRGQCRMAIRQFESVDGAGRQEHPKANS